MVNEYILFFKRVNEYLVNLNIDILTNSRQHIFVFIRELYGLHNSNT